MKINRLKFENQDIELRYCKKNVKLSELSSFMSLLPDNSENYGDKRKTECILARLCAQRDLSDIYAIATGESGVPEFPESMVGSLSHSKDFALAAVSDIPTVKSIGVDIERIIRPERLSVIQRVLTEHESQLLEKKTGSEKLKLATLIFAAKESLYKLINPLAKVYIDYPEGVFEGYDDKTMKFSIRLESTKKELQFFLKVYTGHFGYIENNLYVCLVLR